MRPFHHQLWAYGIYGGIGASFGYWLQDVETRQMRYLGDTRDRLLEKRRRRAEREGMNNGASGAEIEPVGIGEIAAHGGGAAGSTRGVGVA